MFRITLAVLLTLFILAGAAAAQSDDASKRIRQIGWGEALEHCGNPPYTRTSLLVHWGAPKKEPHSYRLSWTAQKKWLGKNKPNTTKAGNAFVSAPIHPYPNYTIRGLEVPCSDKLRVRVRAIYEGERNGPWLCCVTLRKNRASWVVDHETDPVPGGGVQAKLWIPKR